MLSPISWQQYVTAIAVLLFVYYLIVAGRFFLPEVQGQLERRRPTPATALSVLQYPEEPGIEEAEDPLVQQTEQLITRLKTFVQQAPSQPAAIAIGIRNIFKDFPIIKDTQLRAAINELVVTECEKNGAALLTEAEVDQWWDEPAGGA